MGEGVRWSMVESQGERMQRDLEQLERGERAAACLEEGRLARAEELRPRLAELQAIQVDQRQEGEAASAEALDLVQKYNDIMASLTEAFIQVGAGGGVHEDPQADAAVTKAEREAGIARAAKD